MYRTLIPVILCAAASAAPQDSSDITYVKVQPFDRLTESPGQQRPFRESRIEILPLTIPGRIEDLIEKEKVAPQDNATKIVSERSVNDSLVDDKKEDNIESGFTTANYEGETTETDVTERDERLEELLRKTEEYETRTKAPSPRFLSKLSYFKGEDKSTSLLTNLVERTGKKKFKSKCRCEKIWNCPKLQITVPRCPNEYFLCCF